MTVHLHALCWDANDPLRLARFWGAILGRELADGLTVLPRDDTGFRIRLQPTQVPKARQNQ